MIANLDKLVKDWEIGDSLYLYNRAYDDEAALSYFTGNVTLISGPVSPSTVPEPATLVLFSAGLAGAFIKRRF